MTCVQPEAIPPGVPPPVPPVAAAAEALATPRGMTRVLLALLDFYRRWLSPAIHTLEPGGCRYLPTCSEYASMAIAIHGPWRGVALALRRLARCHPFARGGLDPVPPPKRPGGSGRPVSPS
ncbi:MAG: membrane protein insertion efficiency factor YidD [Terracidiphilus sp.]